MKSTSESAAMRGWRITARRLWKLLGPVGPGDSVLDLGCGQGLLAKFGPTGVSVVGVDYDQQSVALAKQWCTEAIQQDLETTPTLRFTDHQFTAVVAKDILEHVVFPQTILSEIRRVLLPGGRLVASVPMEYPWVVWADPTHVRGFTREAAKKLLEFAGFENIEIYPAGGIPLLGRFSSDRWMHRFLEVPGARLAFGRSWHLSANSPR